MKHWAEGIAYGLIVLAIGMALGIYVHDSAPEPPPKVPCPITDPFKQEVRFNTDHRGQRVCYVIEWSPVDNRAYIVRMEVIE